jgi:hypothetical protein
MLNFKNSLQFLGLLLILLTCVLCLNFCCQDHKKEIISNTVFKTDTIKQYVYGGGQGKRIIHKIIRIRDTVTVFDTAIIFRDSNLNLIVENSLSDTPIISYRIKETIIKDSVFITIPGNNSNSLNLGLSGSAFSVVPGISYNTKNCNYLLGYDVKNKLPSFGIYVKLCNIARPKRTGQR